MLAQLMVFLLAQFLVFLRCDVRVLVCFSFELQLVAQRGKDLEFQNWHWEKYLVLQ